MHMSQIQHLLLAQIDNTDYFDIYSHDILY